MRRSRHKLEVSTFPFLAVLLCAMGSLIFLLMVMDRRAKIVARHKLEAKLAGRRGSPRTARAGKYARAVADRQAEWEKERDKLHRMLVEQEREIRSQLGGMAREVDGTAKDLAKKQANTRRRQGLPHSGKRPAAARLPGVDAQKSRGRHAGPARGRRQGTAAADAGSAAHGAIFERVEGSQEQAQRHLFAHPLSRQVRRHAPAGLCRMRRRGLDPASATAPFSRAYELDAPSASVRRSSNGPARWSIQKKPDPHTRGLPATNPNAYVLFLVRPDGIINYSKAQNALDRYAIDYGYELVEPSWVFDFSNEDLARSNPGKMTARGSSRRGRAAGPPCHRPAFRWSAHRNQDGVDRPAAATRGWLGRRVVRCLVRWSVLSAAASQVRPDLGSVGLTRRRRVPWLDLRAVAIPVRRDRDLVVHQELAFQAHQDREFPAAIQARQEQVPQDLRAAALPATPDQVRMGVRAQCRRHRKPRNRSRAAQAPAAQGPGPGGTGTGGTGAGFGSSPGRPGYAAVPPPPTYVFPGWLLYHPVARKRHKRGRAFPDMGPPAPA